MTPDEVPKAASGAYFSSKARSNAKAIGAKILSARGSRWMGWIGWIRQGKSRKGPTGAWPV
jgi:hypothetical protein